MFDNTPLKVVLLLVLIAVLGGQLYGLATAEGPTAEGLASFGEMDFVAFWGGVQVYVSGGDPYVYANVRAFQESAGFIGGDELPFLNPPWALPLLTPVCFLPFRVAKWTWIAVNIGFLVGSALLLRRALGEWRTPDVAFVLGAFTFLPCLHTMQYGQLSLMILFFMSAALWALRNEHDWLAGLCLVPMTMKPHLTLLFLLAGGIWVLRERRWKVAAGLVGGFAGLGLLSASYLPAFLAMDFSPLVIKTSSLATLLRQVLEALTGNRPDWPVTVFPLVGMVITAGWAVGRRFEPAFDGNLLALVGWSLLAAPYAWFWDYSLLLPMHLLLLSRAMQSQAPPRERAMVVGVLFGVQVLVIPVAAATDELSVFFWFPVGVFAAWAWGMKRLARHPALTEQPT